MSNSSLAFAFDEPSPPVVVMAAQIMASELAAGRALSRSDVTRIMTEHFGGSDALGRWSVRDAHAATELAQVQYLQSSDQILLSTPIDEAEQFFCSLDARLPTQTNRSDEQIEWQQFATPPRLAWLAARACALATGELVLEPSAGTGMLAVWAAKAGSRLALNEISPLRRDCLNAMFPAARVAGHDAELIDELLDPAITPSVVLMNPPYSHGFERGHDSRTGSRHLRSAWNRLARGGRLVAIMPEWFDCAKFLVDLKGPISLRLNAAVERAFVKHGTGITTRLLVFDKVEGSNEPATIRTSSFRELVELVDALPARASLEAVTEQSSLPVRAPFRLVAAPRRPLPTSARLTPAATAIGSLTYQSLETPAPLAPQVGHYLPYRPSRIVIDGAAEHPTPLVESVAMGSIAAPMPEAVPQLPEGLVAKGLLSAAQAETLIYAASAHARDLPGRFEPEDKGCSLKASAEGQTYRQGYFLGDGTGAGKGRQVASVILDRWVRGERRHIWISKNEALLEDARRDWAALGGLPIDIQPLASWKLGTPISMREGILFVTYPTLRSGRNEATRLDQILAWAGDDFDGVIVFDEAHAMANAAGGEGSRGKVKGSEQGIAGVRLQNLLPRARVLYASATGASDVNNLAYATRLGLWGPETAFANREAFVADIRDGGIAAME
ncbi:MAG: strawberry notch family protein, partial [Sphingomonadaceae bacterium]|nr:strawberry notch family protein [Sphingomonadaceae bacterium]